MTLLFVFWINFCSLFFHPVYVSVMNMDIEASEKKISMSLRVFTDDMETVLHNRYGIDGWIGTSGEHRNSRDLINEYVLEHVAVTVNRRERLNLSTDSMVLHGDALWIYMRGNPSETIRHIEIDNSVLTDFFNTQTNLVIINTGREEKGYKLNNRKRKIELSL